MEQIKRTLAMGAVMALVLAACGGGAGPPTTEALLPIATNPAVSEAPVPSADGSPAGGLSDTQQSTVDRLIAAWEAGDAAAVLDLWSDEENHYRWDIEFDIALGGVWSDVQCAVTAADQPRCDLMYSNDLLAALEAPLLAGYFRLDLSGSGEIAAWDYDTGNRATTAAYLRPFSDWVQDTDPDAADRMFDWNGFRFPTVESNMLWIAKAEEFLATLG